MWFLVLILFLIIVILMNTRGSFEEVKPQVEKLVVFLWGSESGYDKFIERASKNAHKQLLSKFQEAANNKEIYKLYADEFETVAKMNQSDVFKTFLEIHKKSNISYIDLVISKYFIEFFNKKRIYTSIDDRTIRGNFHAPHGFRLFNLGVDLRDVEKNLDKIFDDSRIYKISIGRKESIKIAIFSNSANVDEEHKKLETYTDIKEKIGHVRKFYARYTSETTVELLNEFLQPLGYKDFISEIVTGICDKIDKNILNCSTHKPYIGIIKYTSPFGIRSHIDSLKTRTKREGPLIAINLNRDIYYDMIPVYNDKYIDPVRIKIPRGHAVFLSGDSRYKWSHAIPNSIPNYAGRYAVVLRFDNRANELNF